jgi:hypothetical protein
MGQNDMFGGAADAPIIMLPQVKSAPEFLNRNKGRRPIATQPCFCLMPC